MDEYLKKFKESHPHLGEMTESQRWNEILSLEHLIEVLKNRPPEPPYEHTCILCDFKETDYKLLQIHMKRVHTIEELVNYMVENDLLD